MFWSIEIRDACDSPLLDSIPHATLQVFPLRTVNKCAVTFRFSLIHLAVIDIFDNPAGTHLPKKNLVDRFLASSSPRQHKSVRLTVKKVRANLRYVEQLWLGTFFVETLSSIAKVTVFGAPGKGTNDRIASPTKFVFPSTQESATWTHFVSLSDVNDIQNDITKWRLRHLAFCCGCQFLETAIRAGVWLRSDSGNAKRCVDMRYSFEVRNAKLIAQISMSTASAPIWWWFGLKFWNNRCLDNFFSIFDINYHLIC